MDSNREIRKKARARLAGRWPSSILVSLLAGLMGGVGICVFMLELPVMLLLEKSAGQLWLALALTVHIVLGLALGCLTELGQDRYYLLARTGKEPEIQELFSLRVIWFKALTLRLLRCGETLLRLLLLIVPGVIALFQYALAPFLLAQNPNLETPEAIRMSSVLMKGYKARLFKFVWGYFGWFLLSICSFGLGFLFLTPYFKAGLAEFYAQRIAEHDADVRRARTAVQNKA